MVELRQNPDHHGKPYLRVGNVTPLKQYGLAFLQHAKCARNQLDHSKKKKKGIN